MENEFFVALLLHALNADEAGSVCMEKKRMERA
jgi:hypothetical protein